MQARTWNWMLVAVVSALVACGAKGAGEVDDPAPAASGASPTSSAVPPSAPAVDAGTPAPPAAAEYWPSSEPDAAWETITPAAAGWDGAKLDAALAYAEEKSSTALIVLVDGRIIAERYWRGWGPHSHAQIFSAAKSMTAILVGIAQERGLLSITDPVTKYRGAGWSKATRAVEAGITIEHLLTMTSGLDDELRTVTAPGAGWYYSTGAYLELGYILEKVSGDRDAFTRDALFDKIGATDSAWMPGGAGRLGQTVDASARDMARFGLMLARGGRWSTGEVVTDKAYLAASTSTSQPHNLAYGRLFWLNGKADYLAPLADPVDGPLIPSAPKDLFAALGKADKKIYVSPKQRWVVVRHGESAGTAGSLAGSSFDDELWKRLIAAAPPSNLVDP